MRRVCGKVVLGYSSRGGRLSRDRKKQYSRPTAGTAVGMAGEQQVMDFPEFNV
jgi:hypothetical protein